MLPKGADSVVMIEHTELLDDTTVEIYRSVAPGQHVMEIGEDFQKDEKMLYRGQVLRPQETGLLAAFGRTAVKVFKKPVIGIISTGDEVVPVDETPGIGQIRDINAYTLAGQVKAAGCTSVHFGIVKDDYSALLKVCSAALDKTDVILLSGGSSMGSRDFTVEVLSALPESNILVHGISISPGKPTILAKAGGKAFWGLPGQVVSAMVVFSAVVLPFIEHIRGVSAGHTEPKNFIARIGRNISSAQGRIDYIRVRLVEKDGELWAQPVLGKSGLINTMVKADGLTAVGLNTEGLEKGTKVEVIPL